MAVTTLALASLSIMVLITAYVRLFLLRINISLCCLYAIKAAYSKLGFTWCPCHMHNTHTHKRYYYFIITLSYGVCARAAAAHVSVLCYYVELCLILLLVMCLSYRYGRRSTPEHNYLALQKSPRPQGKTKPRETVMLLAAGSDVLLHVVFVTTRMMGVADRSTTVTRTEMHLHVSNRIPSYLSN